MKLIIDIPYQIKECLNNENEWTALLLAELKNIVNNGTPLPKGHGKIVDIGKIDEDKIDKDNPIICLTANGEYIEAVSLDYLNNLSTIIEADEG